MPVWNAILNSIKVGWANVLSDLDLSLYAIVNLAFLYCLVVNSTIISATIAAELDPEFTALLFLFISISLLFGAFGNNNLNKKNNIIFSLIGVFFCISLFFNFTSIPGLLFYSILGGFSAGFSLPKIISAFLGNTNFENRGSTCGILVLLAYIVILIFTALQNSSIYIMAGSLLSLKLVSLVLSFLEKSKPHINDTQSYTKFSPRIKASFLLTWFIFILVNALVTVLLGLDLEKLQKPATELTQLGSESIILALIFMVIGGVLMDKYGRKRVMIFAFTYLGLSYGLISISSGVYYEFTILDGIAWGILSVLFLFVLWGDFEPKNRPQWISLSLAIAASTSFITLVFTSPLSNFISFENTFPLTSLFLFLAVGIILYLPETLPDRIMKKKELDEYIKQVKKIKDKQEREK